MVSVYALLALFCSVQVLAQQNEQQITFGLTGGAHLTRQPSTSSESDPRVAAPIDDDDSASSPQRVYNQSLLLLAGITKAAPLTSAPTSYTSHTLPSFFSPLSTLRQKLTSFLESTSEYTPSDSPTEPALQRRFDRWKLGKAKADAKAPRLTEPEVREGMNEVIRMLEEAAQANVADASLLLGDLHLSGHLTLEPDSKLALDYFTTASEEGGLPEAQYKLGFLYASNYGGAVGQEEGLGSQGSALLHYTFAALSGHVPASMTVGYRHWVGIGTKQSCKDALGWYKVAADNAMRTFNAGPPGGRLLPPPKIRLSDLTGGAYGPGASASSRPHITGGSTSQTQQEWDDLVEFHLFHAERGDPTYSFRLGRLYYQGFGAAGLGGTRGGRARLDVGAPGLQDKLWEGGRDFYRASKWFMRVARGVWKSDPGALGAEKGYEASKDPKQSVDDHSAMVAGLAAGYLGRMYMRGEGVKQDFGKAFLWFNRGSGQSDRESTNGLGILYRDGLGVPRDLKRANAYFLAAAQQDLADAQVNLGKYHFGLGEWAVATTYFEHAIRYDGVRQPDGFQAYYYLAELQARSVNRAEMCPNAVSFYKVVAERGDWETEVWWEAERALKRGDERMALLGYWIMAERGYEVAQNNLAWILDRDKKRLRLPLLDALPATNATDRLALAYWTRSAAQDNVDALVKMGDYYFNGLGVDAETGPQLERAAACYQSAVTARISAMAMWNLGWMHENGKGVVQDFHLAKRYYDMALGTSADAYLPATLSLISLYARSLYNSMFGTDADLKSLSLFARPPLTDAELASQSSSSSTSPDPAAAPPAPHWSFSKAWKDIQHRWGFDGGPEGIETDFETPPQAPASQGQGQGPEGEDLLQAQRALQAQEDPLDWARRQGRVGEEEEEDEYLFLDGGEDFGGTLAIVLLVAVLGWLLYFRQGAQQVRQPMMAGPDGQPPPPPQGRREDERDED